MHLLYLIDSSIALIATYAISFILNWHLNIRIDIEIFDVTAT